MRRGALDHKKDQSHSLVSLFSGIGGLDEGLHVAGFRPLASCEIDPFARLSLRHWLDTKGLQACPIYDDVTQLDPLQLMADLGIGPGDLDLLAGGPPCQPFSAIGQRASLGDHRGLLIFDMVRFAAALRPKAILMEQVKGLLSAPGFNGDRGGALDSLVRQLEALGYIVSHQVLRAADYGVPQLRDRLFIVATQETQFVFPRPTHAPASEITGLFSHLSPYRTVADAIANLPRPTAKGEPERFPNHVDVTPQRDRERINGVPEGDWLARQFHLPAEQRQRLSQKDSTKFRRLAWDSPSLTLRGGETFYHPSENRYLTPRECMRLHGFSDDHILHGPIRGRSGSVKNLDQHRQVANSVPPPLAAQLGHAITQTALTRELTLGI